MANESFSYLFQQRFNEERNVKLCIPKLGSVLILTSEWQFTLIRESRNKTFFQQVVIKPGVQRELISLPAGTQLKVERVYIRQGAPEYDSVTFRIVGQKNARFWVRLEDANKIEFREPEEPIWFHVQNCYQDGHWEYMEGERYAEWDKAVNRAAELCKDSIAVGMTRVICPSRGGGVLVTFPAGGYVH
jgi:hypothetical protein